MAIDAIYRCAVVSDASAGVRGLARHHVVLLVLAIAGLVADRLIPEASVTDELAVLETVATVALATDDRSIAVLPFADLSQSQDQQYFTDGLSEELLNLLVRVDDLRVAARTSSFAFRGSTLGIPEISRALNVGHIPEGSVRKDGDRIRITVQLIEAATENRDAYEMYLIARALLINRDQLPDSIRLFRKAVELDPNFARAWASLGAVEVIIDEWVGSDGVDHQQLAKKAAEKALSLDPESSIR